MLTSLNKSHFNAVFHWNPLDGKSPHSFNDFFLRVDNPAKILWYSPNSSSITTIGIISIAKGKVGGVRGIRILTELSQLEGIQTFLLNPDKNCMAD